MEVNDAEEEGNNEDDEDDEPGPTHRPARRRRRRTRQIGNGIDAVMVYVDTGEVVSEDEDENDEDRNEVDQSDEPGTHVPRRGRRGTGAGAAQSRVPPHTGTPPRRQRRPEMTEVGSGTELGRRHDNSSDNSEEARDTIDPAVYDLTTDESTQDEDADVAANETAAATDVYDETTDESTGDAAPAAAGTVDVNQATATATTNGTVDHPHINAWAAAPVDDGHQPAPDMLML